MITLNDISLTFADKQLFSHISYTLPREVVGLVGDNGVGKTTLLNIITGIIKPDAGSVTTSHEIVGYLPQHIVLTEPGTNTLSGGEKTKRALELVLSGHPQPTVLLLDEPTNNLDLDGIYWLEQLLANFPGPVLMTSHDRMFLDEIADSIIEMSEGKLRQYGGNYTAYIAQKQQDIASYDHAYESQQKKIQSVENDVAAIKTKARMGEESFSSRNPYQRRKIRKSAHLGVVRQRRLEKFLSSEDVLEKRTDLQEYPFHFEGENHNHKYIVGAQHLSLSFGETRVIHDLTFSVTGTEHVWISGPNGSGKTSLLRMIIDDIPPTEGTLIKGETIRIGYFSQETTLPDTTQSAVEYLTRLGATATEAFRYGSFMRLTKEDLIKPLKTLSKGQQAKIAVIQLLMNDTDLLILDEPTNHLEISTREQIEDALRGYRGAMVVASHDRYFLSSIRIDKEIKLAPQ